MEGLKRKDMDVVVVAGGIIPENDIPVLKKIGIKAVFGPGTNTSEIVEAVNKLVKEKEKS